MNVLVVDDDVDLRYLVGRVLSLAGMDVREADGAIEALKLLWADPDWPDAVVLDVQMPGMDGWEALRAIRANPSLAEVRVVMCTVKGSQVDVDRGWKLGCDGYVTKPFDIDVLVGTVQGVLSGR
jgi:DNA-binding response OmpR family regulator